MRVIDSCDDYVANIINMELDDINNFEPFQIIGTIEDIEDWELFINAVIDGNDNSRLISKTSDSFIFKLRNIYYNVSYQKYNLNEFDKLVFTITQ